jgi:hypothetical protein
MCDVFLGSFLWQQPDDAEQVFESSLDWTIAPPPIELRFAAQEALVVGAACC